MSAEDTSLPGVLDFLGGLAAGRFGRGIVPRPGLSFSAADAPNDTVLSQLHLRSQRSEPTGEQVFILGDDRGLELHVSVRQLPKHRAIVYRARLHNVGDQPVHNVKDLCSFDLRFERAVIGAPTVHTINGGVTHYYFPPRAFQIAEHTILGGLTGRFPLRISSAYVGRSSEGNLPVFVVEDGAREAGVYGGLEWSGDWQIDFDCTDDHFIIRGGIWGVDLTLQPGESIPLAQALFGFYEGDAVAGTNALRRCLHDEYLPLLEGRKPLPPVSYDHWFKFRLQFDEALMRQQADAAAQIGIEYFVVDAGWYAGCERPTDNFSIGVGNWLELDRSVFPNGLRPLSDYVRERGMKFGLWFEPERAALTSTLAREHPDWVLKVTADKKPLLDLIAPRQRVDWHTHGLVDFGNPAVREWMKAMFEKMLSENRIQWIRWDFNMDPRFFWEFNDPPGRRGIGQLRHVEGLYEVLDWVQSRFPDLLIEGCSSGGRRIDLGILRRSHTIWISDHTADEHIVRNHLSGANHFLPAAYLNTNLCHAEADYPDFFYHCAFPGALGFGEDFRSWSPEAIQRARQMVERYKSFRHLLEGDFYALLPQPRSLIAWDALQYHDPATSTGLVMVYRLQSPTSEQRVRLQGVTDERRYRVRDTADGSEYPIATGAELLRDGLPVALSLNGSIVLTYEPA